MKKNFLYNYKSFSGILDSYNTALNNVDLAGPTLFNYVLAAMKARVQSSMENFSTTGRLNYHILLILTDGAINDIADTVDRIVELSFLPISIIIIGVGSADFSSMVYLDSDEKKLVGLEI